MYTSAECRATAYADTLAEAASNYAYTCVAAFLSGCKQGHETIPDVVRKEARAAVSVRYDSADASSQIRM